MKYKTEIHPDAIEDLAALPKKNQRQIDKKIRGLANNPRPSKARLLKGYSAENLWKVRGGDYRIIYSIDDKVLLVWVIMVGNRKDVYKRLMRKFS